MRGKKRFLSFFVSLGVIGTGLLVVVNYGDWLLASLLFILGRVGFAGANVFYDALLPHVAKEEDLDVVSSRGFALGYLGGGLLLAINIVMIQYMPDLWGSRLSFLSVAIWWAVFSIPIFRRVPEPPAATEIMAPGENVVSVSFKRLWSTIKDIRQYKELFKYLIAFLLYVDGIGTIIGVAVIYGAELGFDSISMIAALLMVQFVGIPYSLIFGRLPSKNENRRPFYLAFVLFNAFALPLVGVFSSGILPSNMVGTYPAPYSDTDGFWGEGDYAADHSAFVFSGDWIVDTISATDLGSDADKLYIFAMGPDANLAFPFNGKTLEITHSTGPDHGTLAVEIDGAPFVDDEGTPLIIDAYNPTVRYDVVVEVEADQPGEHVLVLINMDQANPESSGKKIGLAQINVLEPDRISNLGIIIGLILATQLVGLAFALLLGKPLFGRVADKIDTRRAILLGLFIYAIIAIWGYFIDSVVEFWFLAWMVAVVQGGSQALSRSLFSAMVPAAKSGEFFGLFGIMEKFSSILGPLVFAWAAATFGSSRPAVLSLIAFFILGGYLLTRVDIDEGKRVAQKEDATLLKL
jgi:MFS-type transporter involved in bile tolerance (Atg22 family)